MIAIQLDVLTVGEQLLLHFTQVLDQTQLRVDDADEEEGGGQTNRAYWDKKAGSLMKQCDSVLEIINAHASAKQEFSYLRGYIGLQSNGVVNNFITMAPKPTKKFAHFWFRNANTGQWKEKFDEVGIPASSKRKVRLRISVTPDEFAEHKGLIEALIVETVKESET